MDLLLSSRQPGLGPRGARGGPPLRPARLPASAHRLRCPPEKPHDAIPFSRSPITSLGAHYPSPALPSRPTSVRALPNRDFARLADWLVLQRVIAVVEGRDALLVDLRAGVKRNYPPAR